MVLFSGVTADRKHCAVERNDVIIVVLDDGTCINENWRPFFKVEPVEMTAAVKDQSSAISCPVGRFKHIVFAVDDLSVAVRHVQNFQSAAEGVLSTVKPLFHRHDHACIVVDNLLHNGI